MSNRATSWAIEIPDLPPTTKLVLLLLADCHNGGTGQCNPSPEWLSVRAGMKVRAIQMHLRKLEDLGLLEREYEYHGRGKGCSVNQFNLKIGIISKRKEMRPQLMEAQNNADAKICARKKTSLRTQDLALSYKDEPELEPEDINVAFDRIWGVWSSDGRKRSKAKRLCIEALKAQTKHLSADKIANAATMFAKATDGRFHPALERWLRDGKYENWQGRDMAAPQIAEAPPEYSTFKNWLLTMHLKGEWPNPYEPGPDDPNNRIPPDLIEWFHELEAQKQGAA